MCVKFLPLVGFSGEKAQILHTWKIQVWYWIQGQYASTNLCDLQLHKSCRLQSENLFAASEIRSLSDEPNASNASKENSHVCRVTREQILENLRWLLTGDGEASDPESVQLLFHFSGHGDGAKLFSTDESTISDYELSEMIHDLLPENATLTCIFDCCDGTKMLQSLLPRHILAFGTTKHWGITKKLDVRPSKMTLSSSQKCA